MTSSGFGGAVMENWQSEFLQFSLFIAATIWLVQKGSNESKRSRTPDSSRRPQQRIGRHTPAGGPTLGEARRLAHAGLRELAPARDDARSSSRRGSRQSLNNWREFNDDARQHDGRAISWASYLVNADFWEKTLQNWQSEFLAVGTMVVFTIYLRQRGSPESKPVGAPHDETGSSG